MIQHVLAEVRDWSSALIFALPGKTGQAARALWARIFFQSWGRGARIARGSIVDGVANISVGERVQFGQHTILSADQNGHIIIGADTNFNHGVTLNTALGGSLVIGKYCLIGPNVTFRTANHRYDDVSRPILQQGHEPGDIVLGDDVWIGAHAVILPEVTIGDGAMIAAGAVVTRPVAAYTVVGGVPAKVISERKPGL